LDCKKIPLEEAITIMSMKPNYSTIVLTTLSALAVPFSLGAKPESIETHAAVGSVLGEGVQCLLAPSTAYKPGTVFRIDQQHVSYLVDQPFADKIQPRQEEATLGSLSGRADVNLNVLAWLLQVPRLVHTNVSSSATRPIDVRFEDVTWESTDDEQIGGVIHWFAGYQHKREGSEYFVVREAWKVGAMRMKLPVNLASDLSAGGSVAQLLKTNYELKYEPAAQYSLSESFPEPLRVCIKPERLVGDGGADLHHTEPVRGRLIISGQDVDKD
jgi:hypothetical protein